MKPPTREQLINSLCEAAELEHDLMCTYLYAAFTIKTDPADGITAPQAARASGWRRAIMGVAREEMGHLAAVWNITSALGASPRFGRGNFPIDPGPLPGSVIARLAPFDDDVVQHFIYLERPVGSREHDGASFPHARPRSRAAPHAALTPMGVDYDTIGAFYATLGDGLRTFVEQHGERAAFCNDASLQLTTEDVQLPGLHAVRCARTALAAFASIVEQGEGAPASRLDSHFEVFRNLRAELADAWCTDDGYVPAFPAARDPVLRPPVSEARVWIADPEAAATVDLANAIYNLMLRLLAYTYQVPRGAPERRVAIGCALGLMRAMTPVAERAVRLPAGPEHPGVHAGMTFTAPRDGAPLPRGTAAWRLFDERFEQLIDVTTTLATAKDARLDHALRMLVELRARAQRAPQASVAPPVTPPVPVAEQATPQTGAPLPTSLVAGGRRSEGSSLAVLYDGKRCIHTRSCVTGAPAVFVEGVTRGPWIHPDEAAAGHVLEVIHRCPSGALRYQRADGVPEPVPPVNVITLRESGPYVFRADMLLAGAPAGYRLTLCRCGASKNKPFCDNSHRTSGFEATSEPPTRSADALPAPAGPLAIEPTLDGPLELDGNVEITSGSGRVVARVTHARLCRCGASATKPFCDQSHLRIGFRSDP